VYYYLFGTTNLGALEFGLFAIVLLVNFFPVVILHTQYLIKNWNAILIIDTDKETFEFILHKKKYHYAFKDIEQLKYYATSGHISVKGSSFWYTFDPYRFFKIILKDHTEIIVTCLMMNNIENRLEKLLQIEATRKFRALPLIY
jgi:hypothetical protein